MGPGGPRGLQSRCEARRTSRVCSIRTRLRHIRRKQEPFGASFHMLFYLRSIAGNRVDGPLSVRPESDDASLPYRVEGRRLTYAHRVFERCSHSVVGI